MKYYINKAFTLIELLVVIAIISLLVSILLPALNTAKELAKLAVCKSNLRSMGISANLYSSDMDGKLPSGSLYNWPSKGPTNDFFGYQMKPYLGDTILAFCCPLSDKSSGSAYYKITYGSGTFVTTDAGRYCDQTYVYLGNYAYENATLGDKVFFNAQEQQDIADGIIYPRSCVSQRALLFQDTVSNHSYDNTNHPKPNRLFTDASVEAGPDDPTNELDAHVKYTGFLFYW